MKHLTLFSFAWCVLTLSVLANPDYPPTMIHPGRSGGQLGQALAVLGTNHFLSTEPLAMRTESGILKRGSVSLFALGRTNAPVTLFNPTTNGFFGQALAVIDGSRFVVTSPITNAAGGRFHLCRANFLPDSSGVLTAAVQVVTTVTNHVPQLSDGFGSSAAVVGGTFLVIGAPKHDSLTVDMGRAYLYRLVGSSVTYIGPLTNPAPTAGASFGQVISAVGSDRFVVSAPTASIGNRAGAGKLFLYSTNGTLLKTITDPNPLSQDRNQNDNFGFALSEVGVDMFAASATGVDQITAISTNLDVGALYLFHKSGQFLRTIVPPPTTAFNRFGSSVAGIGTDRFLVGATNAVGGGQVYMFSTSGDWLTTLENPQWNIDTPSDQFGHAMASVGNDWFLVGATTATYFQGTDGAVYYYDARLPEYTLGQEIEPPPGLALADLVESGPEIIPAGAAFWHRPNVYDARLYGTRAGRITVRWKTTWGNTITVQALNVWPANPSAYQTNVAQTPPVSLRNGGTFNWAAVMDSEDGVDVDSALVRNRLDFSAAGSGRSLLMLAANNPIQDPSIYFQLVRTVTWDDLAYLHDHSPGTPGQQDAPALIGTELNSLGYHDPTCGGGWVFFPNSFYNADPGYYDRTNRTGPIIPVNLDQPTYTDDMVVVYYQKSSTLVSVPEGTVMANTMAWPWKAVRYQCQWPNDAEKLIIANTAERPAIDAIKHLLWELYVQNDPSRPGFNPNDEHALRFPSAAGEAIFPLRDDLGTPTTSQPYVLIKYFDFDDDLTPKMKVFRVVAEESPYTFDYAGDVGKRIQPPFPLSIMPLCNESFYVSGPCWRDRKKEFWSYAAGNDGVSPVTVVMKYFYPVQNGFYVPSNYFAYLPAGVIKSNLPAVGTHLPWLDVRAGTRGTPHDIRYDISWPDAPILFVGETLIKPKRGLPDIRSQSSVQIIYQQGMAQGGLPSVVLIDPTRERTTNLAVLPAGIETVNRAGKKFFPALPPQLRNRLFFDPLAPVAERLKLRGEFVQPPLGEGYLLLNLLTDREKDTAKLALPGLAASIDALPSSVITVASNATSFDSLALTAGFARRGGFVTLAFGNNPALSPESEPVSLAVIRVDCGPFTGEIRVVDSNNPFDEKLTLRHSGDFAGRADQFIFEWKTRPSENGMPSPLEYENWTYFPTQVAAGHQPDQGAVDITIKGANILTLSDNYFVCRYRPVSAPVCSVAGNPLGWSEWTAPMLAEGWIKRVLAGINTFEQRIKSYEDNRINSIVSMIAQAGPRYEGPVPLSLQAADDFGLIEIYETVLRRGMDLSIDGLPPVDYPPGNIALLLAAGRLADLYMLLGNESYADAADPTIAFGTDDGIYGAEATSIHCFMNQTASLLEEELALLRGRDDSLQPSVTTRPIYNRLAWNFTRDINGGEVAYALNYNVRDEAGHVDGLIDESDAKALYPQGHGDAWGHYLTAIKRYYQLLRHPRFTWTPQSESVLVGGVPVLVDYLDERKFARAAAAKARTGAEITDLTYRQDYQAGPGSSAADYHDPKADRAWGVADWGSRAGQGAYLDWLVANAILPDRDPTLITPILSDDNTGVQIVDRTTVMELREIVASAQDIQAKVDAADGGMNPVGLADTALPFDLNPQEVDQGHGHFDQIFERAVRAMNNAVTVFNHANNSTQLLRRQADHQDEFVTQVDEREMDFQNRLIEVFGYPYEDDIGPAGTYPSGYDGPDIYHFEYNDASELAAFKFPPVMLVTLPMQEMIVASNGNLNEIKKPIEFNIATDGTGLIKPAAWKGRRRAQGELQMARSDMILANARFKKALTEYDNLIDQIQDQAALIKSQHDVNEEEIEVKTGAREAIQTLNEQIRSSRERQLDLRKALRIVNLMQDAIAEALPKSVGLANDITSVARSALRIVGVVMSEVQTEQADAESMMEADRQDAKEVNDRLDEIKLITSRNDQGVRMQVAQLEQLVRQEVPLRLEIYTLRENITQSGHRYMNTLARAQRLLDERLRFRQQTASQIQGYRYKDMAFRIFRNDALQKYRSQFDLAARYVYLAAKAFDYETCLPDDHAFASSRFVTDILRARSLGFLQAGQPQVAGSAGDIGLADPLAWMHLYWTLIAQSELGFNNPQTDTGRFSLRSELFRIQRGEAGNATWRETLSRLVVPHFPDLPEVRRYCVLPSPLSTAEPALVIPFSTTINFGHNFFAWPLGGGDNAYDSTHNATKIRSVGVWLANYNSLVDQGLANTPHVYLIPVGSDFQRCPPDETGHRAVREWKVFEQKLPVPFQFNRAILQDNLGWIPFTDSVPPGEKLAEIRKHPMFRAYHDSGSFTPSETINASRLIGRSVWNSRWLLIIPGGALHYDRNEGIQRLIHGPMVNGQRNGNGVSDIKLFFQTYSYAGN